MKTIWTAAAALLFSAVLGTGTCTFAASETPASDKAPQRLEINLATARQLAALGILSPKQAEAVVQLREEMGELRDYKQLERIGLDKATLEKLKSKTTISIPDSNCNC